jgi:hypothetical protein
MLNCFLSLSAYLTENIELLKLITAINHKRTQALMQNVTFCRISTKIGISTQNSAKIPNMNFHEIRPLGVAKICADRQTDMATPIVTCHRHGLLSVQIIRQVPIRCTTVPSRFIYVPHQ